MWLDDRSIKDSRENDDIYIHPFVLDQLKPNSYDVRLGHWFTWLRFYKDGKPHFSDFWSMMDGEKVLVPVTGTLLAITWERIGARRIVSAELRGRSSTARKGIQVNSDAGIGEPGYFDQFWTLSLTTNTLGSYLVVGEPVAQIVFHRLTSSAGQQYDGQYKEDDWPYVMIPSDYRSNYRNIRYEENNRVIISTDQPDPAWKELIIS